MAMSPRLLRPRASGFTPKNISDLGFWLDFSDASTLTLNAGNVSEARDKSGLGRNFTQVAALQQPAFTASARNGRSGIYFDAGKNLLCTPLSLAQPTTWFVVFQAPTTGTGTWALFDGNTARQHVFGNTSTEMRMFAGGNVVIATLAASTWYVAVLTYNGAASTYRVTTTAGTLVSSGTVNAGTNAITSAFIGSSAGVRGNIGEIGIYGKALSVAEAERIGRYLERRWHEPPPTASNADAQSWINAVYANGGAVSTATAAAVNTFATSIESAGLRDRFYRLNLFAGTGLSAALVPLYRGPSLGGTQFGNTTDTNTNFVSGDYVETGATGGLKGDGSTKSLNTGFAANNLTEGDRHISVYENAKTTSTFDRSIGSDGTIGNLNTFVLGTWTPAGVYSFGFGNGGSTIQASGYSGGAHWIGINGSAGSGVLYKNGSSAASGSLTAATPGSENIRVFALGRGTTSADFADARMGGYSIGVAMTGAQVSTYYTALQALQTALTRNV
jgi:hypothetical protein